MSDLQIRKLKLTQAYGPLVNNASNISITSKSMLFVICFFFPNSKIVGGNVQLSKIFIIALILWTLITLSQYISSSIKMVLKSCWLIENILQPAIVHWDKRLESFQLLIWEWADVHSSKMQRPQENFLMNSGHCSWSPSWLSEKLHSMCWSLDHSGTALKQISIGSQYPHNTQNRIVKFSKLIQNTRWNLNLG